MRIGKIIREIEVVPITVPLPQPVPPVDPETPPVRRGPAVPQEERKKRDETALNAIR